MDDWACVAQECHADDHVESMLLVEDDDSVVGEGVRSRGDGFSGSVVEVIVGEGGSSEGEVLGGWFVRRGVRSSEEEEEERGRGVGDLDGMFAACDRISVTFCRLVYR